MTTEVLSEKYAAAVIAHSAATTAKEPLLVNSVPVIPLNDADADEDNVFVYEAAKVRVPKATGQAWSALGSVYWDDTNGNFTTTSTDNTLAGVIVEDADSDADEGIIHLTPFA